MGRTITTLGTRDAGMRLSSHEFAAAEFEQPYGYERISGRLVVMTPAGHEHRSVSRPFRRSLGLYWGQHTDLVDDVDVEGWVATGPDDDRIPDICVYLTGPSSQHQIPHRVPDLIFEFVSVDRSDQERDYIDKRGEYHAIGVKEYVVVDRLKQAVLVLTWQEPDFSERWLARDDVYMTPLLPGLSIPLSEAFI